MAQWENISGDAVSVPIVDRDVGVGEVIEVPDDVVFPSSFFRLVDAPVPLVDAPAPDALVEAPAPVVDTLAVAPVEGE